MTEAKGARECVPREKDERIREGVEKRSERSEASFFVGGEKRREEKPLFGNSSLLFNQQLIYLHYNYQEAHSLEQSASLHILMSTDLQEYTVEDE